jgi:hypothetical protein
MKNILAIGLIASSIFASDYATAAGNRGRPPVLKSRIYRLTCGNEAGEPSNAVRDVYKAVLPEIFKKKAQRAIKNPLYNRFPNQPEWVQELHWEIMGIGPAWFEVKFESTQDEHIDGIVERLQNGQYSYMHLLSLELVQLNDSPCSTFLELKPKST